MTKAKQATPADATKGRLPKVYLRLDPNIDNTHPDPGAFVKLLCAANRQPVRGWFKSYRLIEAALGRGVAKRLRDLHDVKPKAEGDPASPWYVEGWDDWQEGDLDVGERVARHRAKAAEKAAALKGAADRYAAVTGTVTETVTEAVTEPLPTPLHDRSPLCPPSDSPPISPGALGVRLQALDAAVAANTTTPTAPASGETAATDANAEYSPVEVLKCPDCEAVAVIRQNPDRSGGGFGWVCFKRQGGCGMVFPVGEQRLLDQLHPRQIEAVRRSVERLTGGNGAIKAAPDLALEAARRRVAHLIEQAAEEPADKVWDQVSTVLGVGIDKYAHATWIRPTRCYGMLRDGEGARLVIGVPNQQIGNWIARNYWRNVEAALRELGRGELRVLLVSPNEGGAWTLGPTVAEEIAQRAAREAS